MLTMLGIYHYTKHIRTDKIGWNWLGLVCFSDSNYPIVFRDNQGCGREF